MESGAETTRGDGSPKYSYIQSLNSPWRQPRNSRAMYKSPARTQYSIRQRAIRGSRQCAGKGV